MLRTENITYSYDGKTKLVFPDIHCRKSEQWLLLGQSGSGKTTLLHLLAGLMRPSQGEIFIDGQDITRIPGHKLDIFRGKNIGLIFQRSHFVRALSTLENLLLAQHLSGKTPSRERAMALLDRLKIAYKAHAKPDRLSQGEQQRLAIARALINHPKIILADEPTSALDDVNTAEVVTLLEEQARVEGATLLIVTHDGRLKQEFANQIQLEPQHHESSNA